LDFYLLSIQCVVNYRKAMHFIAKASSALLLAFSSLAAGVSGALLNVDGFAWAENLAFDGLGSLFVSEAVRGELWRIYPCGKQRKRPSCSFIFYIYLNEFHLWWLDTSYCKKLHISKGINAFGGLAVVPDGKTIFAGVTFSDGTVGVISTSTSALSAGTAEGTYSVLSRALPFQPNGMAADWDRGVLYCTDEIATSVIAVSIRDGSVTTISKDVSGADGAWFDAATGKLYVGELGSMKIWVYDVVQSKFVGEFSGLSSMRGIHMLDDITLGLNGTNPVDLKKTILFGADFTGKQLMQFTLDGTTIAAVPPPAGVSLTSISSARWGKGPGFDSKSLYVTEAGGVSSRDTSHRVIQIPI
jgi:hypothetical protein